MFFIHAISWKFMSYSVINSNMLLIATFFPLCSVSWTRPSSWYTWRQHSCNLWINTWAEMGQGINPSSSERHWLHSRYTALWVWCNHTDVEGTSLACHKRRKWWNWGSYHFYDYYSRKQTSSSHGGIHICKSLPTQPSYCPPTSPTLDQHSCESREMDGSLVLYFQTICLQEPHLLRFVVPLGVWRNWWKIVSSCWVCSMSIHFDSSKTAR